MIAIDLQTFQQGRAGGNMTGVIFLDLQDGPFPEQGWSDFPVIILGWWADAWLQLSVPTRREVEWRFMDGPYVVTLSKATDAGSAAFDFSHVHRSLVAAGEGAVTHCEQHRMLSRDLDLLRAYVQRLKADQTLQRAGGGRFPRVEIRPSVSASSRRRP